MVSRLRRPSFSFPCIVSNVSNLICRTADSPPFPSDSSRKRGLSLPSLSHPLQIQLATSPMTSPNRSLRRSLCEVLADFYGSESTDAAADDFRSVHRDSPGRWPLFVGFGCLRHCRL